jgi:hypothetical protein
MHIRDITHIVAQMDTILKVSVHSCNVVHESFIYPKHEYKLHLLYNYTNIYTHKLIYMIKYLKMENLSNVVPLFFSVTSLN